MSEYRPINSNHSIDEVVFVFLFSRPFSEENIQYLIDIEEKITNGKLKKEIHQGTEVKVGPQGEIKAQPVKVKSLHFKGVDESNNLEWLIRVESKFISINCLNYSRWENIWEKAFDYFKILTPHLISTDNPIESVSLQYLDRFVYNGKIENYKTTNIFNEGTDYLNRKIAEVGPFWHLHQGWFNKNIKIGSRILNRLNITAAMADKEHHTTVDHNATIQFDPKITNFKTLFEDVTDEKLNVVYFFESLHLENKVILRNLLNETMKKEINLN